MTVVEKAETMVGAMAEMLAPKSVVKLDCELAAPLVGTMVGVMVAPSAVELVVE